MKLTKLGIMTLAATALAATQGHADPGGQTQTEHGGEMRTFLGVHVTKPNPALAAQLGLENGFGVVVEAVQDGSPAAGAGLQRFDVLTKLDDQILVNPDQFITLVHRMAPGDQVDLTLLRRASENTVSVELGQTTATRQMIQTAVANAFQVPAVTPNIRFPEGEAGSLGIDVDIDVEKLVEGIDSEIEEVLPQNLSIEIRKQIMKALKDGASAFGGDAGQTEDEIELEAPGATSQVVIRNSNTAKTIVVKTHDGTTATIIGDGKDNTIRVTNGDGALIYEGAYNDAEDRSRVPAAVREKLQVLGDLNGVVVSESEESAEN